MFTVTVGFDTSGKSSTLRPLARRYSVIPSTVAPFTGPAGVTFGTGLAACAPSAAAMNAGVANDASDRKRIDIRRRR